MGTNRRSRHNNNSNNNAASNQQQHHAKNEPSSESSSSSAGGKTKSSATCNDLDFYSALQEVETDGVGNTPQQVTLLLLLLIVPIVLATVIGIAAGMTISIHYFEKKQQFVQKSACQKITALDPAIASLPSSSSSSSVANNQPMDLGTVVTANANGQWNVLMVVDEIAPLYPAEITAGSSSDDDGYNTERTTQHPSESSSSSSSSSSSHTIPITPTNHYPTKLLSPEQAERIQPGYGRWEASQPRIALKQPTVLPSLCSDGVTYGFDSWTKLRTAIHEANSISAERFMKWNEYFATHSQQAFRDDSLYYEQDTVFEICPHTTLKARRGPIFVNAENIVLECDGCVIDVGGTHLAFGANAKNALVRGITFRRASTSSLTFHQDGADASFEDCAWVNDSGISNYYGSIANLNSTSVLNFYRCEISLGKKHIAMGTTSATTNSLSLRA